MNENGKNAESDKTDKTMGGEAQADKGETQPTQADDTKHMENRKEENKAEQIAELKEKMLRLAAEFDNYKKRAQKDLDESVAIGNASLIKEMLPVLDEFELAIMALGKSGDREMTKGIEMLYSNFVEVLRKNGLKETKCEGTFNPFKHEIVMVRESKEKEGTIIGVLKKGYELSGRLLRPASVIISKPAAKNSETEKSDNKNDKNNK
jgi:molecular chaperone GrpE